MARVKVKLADNLARVVFIESDATKGATLGTDVMLNGKVATPQAVAQWLGGGGQGGGGTGVAHSSLSGLQQGNDHPQYARWQAAERVTAQWSFDKQLRTAAGTLLEPALGFTNDTDTGVYSPAAGQLGLVSNGTETFRFGASGQLGIGGANYGTQDQALLSGGSSAAPVWTTLAAVALSNDYDDLDNKPTIPPDLSALNFITSTDETTALTNSRRLVAGPNITLDTTTPGQITIDAVSGGTGTVTSVGTGTGLTGGPITSSGTISLDSASIASLSLANSALQPGDYDAVTFLSSSDETATFPASRQLLAGSNVTFDTSTPGQLTINAAGGGGGGQVDSIGAGTGISVNSTNPVIPVVAVNTGATFSWSAKHTFTAPGDGIATGVTLAHGTRPTLEWYTTGAGTDQKRWFAGAVNNEFYLFTRNDAGAGGATWLRATRSGVDVPLIEVSTAALGVGISPTGPTGTTFHVGSSTSGATFHLSSSTSGHSALDGFVFQFWTDNNAYAWNYENGAVVFGTNAVERLRITSSGQLYGTALHNNPSGATGTANQYIASGTYTPSIAGGAGLGTISDITAQWVRVGNVVTVSGGFRGNTGSSPITGYITLPIPSTVGSGVFLSPLAGTLAALDGTYPFVAAIRGATSGINQAYFEGGGSGSPGSNLEYAFHFTYLVV